uniref:F-box domain-containing protein n=1 Tax=Oryza punctata TaxID=4537 RepID=A0A0E0JF44_ORYPU
MSGDGGDPFDSLPAAIAADVLNRVADGAVIAACRLASRALLAASYACSRVRLRAAALARRRAVAVAGPGGGPGGSAIRAAAGNVASLLGPHLRSLELDASEGWGHPDDATWVEEGEFDEGDDLHLTAREAVMAWADTAGGHALREVDVADYWPQSCWRKAEALPVISHFCHNLMKLRLKNAWLSVDGLKIMPNLTHLTLEFIRLDDEDLNKLNECFPCLQILNLIGVGGLKDPKIHLHQLKTCHWEVSNVPRSLTIRVPNLVHLELKCVRPDMLILDTPSMSTLKLTVDKLGPNVQVDGLGSLKNLRIESLDLKSLLQVFAENRDITTLELELPTSTNTYELFEAVKPEYLLQVFASISEVKLAPRFSCEMTHCLMLCTSNQFRSCLRRLLFHLPPLKDVPHLAPLFKNCDRSCEVTILFHADSSDDIRQAATSVWTLRYPGMRWQWGTWN